MPAILERLVSQLRASGHNKESAYAIATAAMEKYGYIDKHGNATAKGLERGRMTPSARAKDRAAKASGRPASQYKYNSQSNRATLKKNASRKK